MLLVSDQPIYQRMLPILLLSKESEFLKKKESKKPVMGLQWLLRILIILRSLFRLKWILPILLRRIMKLREPNNMDILCKMLLLRIIMLLMGLIRRLEYGLNLIPLGLVPDSLCVDLLLLKRELNSKLILDDFYVLKYII